MALVKNGNGNCRATFLWMRVVRHSAAGHREDRNDLLKEKEAIERELLRRRQTGQR
jgi:hypothetical protein